MNSPQGAEFQPRNAASTIKSVAYPGNAGRDPRKSPRYRDADIIIVNTCSQLSLFERFNSLIAQFVSLFAGFISLFGYVGNLLSPVAYINHLDDGCRSPEGPESAFSQYFPVTRELERDPTSGCARLPDGARA